MIQTIVTSRGQDSCSSINSIDGEWVPAERLSEENLLTVIKNIGAALNFYQDLFRKMQQPPEQNQEGSEESDIVSEEV